MSISWSRHNPKLQIALDGTSWDRLQRCARLYQLNVIEGWRKPENPHLDFGSMFQEAREIFQLARLRGVTKHEATKAALRRAIQLSGWYDAEPDPQGEYPFYTWTPWGGDMRDEWRCSGTEPYMVDGKKSKRKCPMSHAGKWFTFKDTMLAITEIQVATCVSHCASPIVVETHYIPDHPQKNRANLLRAVCAMADAQTETGGLQPWAFPDGTPAVEINLTVPMGRKTPHGEDYLLVANFDEINSWRGRLYITDNKTTKDPLNDFYFSQFAPNAQFDFYDLVASIALSDLDIAGLAVNGVQVTKENVDIKTAKITKTPGQREETWRDLNLWIDLAERSAAADYWPMTRTSCKGCDFNGICDMDPEMRRMHLEQDFEQRGSWDPIERPGRRSTSDDDDPASKRHT